MKKRIAWNKGKKLTKEHIKKLRESHLGKKVSGNRKLGWKLSEETKNKISKNNARYWLGKKRLETGKLLRGKNHSFWAGDNVGYSALHKWVRSRLGKPKLCKFCGVNNKEKKIDWANKSGKYIRDLSDWIRLCRKCHKNYDLKRINLCDF